MGANTEVVFCHYPMAVSLWCCSQGTRGGLKWQFTFLCAQQHTGTHRHTHTRLLRSGSRLVHQPVSLHPSLVLVMLCVCVCVRVPTGAAELLGQRQWRRWWEWRRRRRAQTYDRHSFSHQNQRALWFLCGSLKLPKPISGTYFRLFSGYFILPINGGPSKGKTELRYFTLCVCETLNGPCCCVKPPCFQFGELEESGVLLFG